MRKLPRTAIIIAVLIFGIWTFGQLLGTLRHSDSPKDARLLLYEASLFQTELLSSSAGESGKARTTQDLQGLKQAAFSAAYTHEKLAEAWGSAVPSLSSPSKAVEWIVRMQIGGDRALTQEEQEMLVNVSPYFQELYDAYSHMVNKDGRIVGSSVDKLKEADRHIAELLSEQFR
ncbi:S-adenosylmethionine decarboxylase [Paenibacillus thermotolerans]|uniref:S-adenosylmethionine decarboxylase n=1 Tax=Paenibacillus thermotolerans TaxID=3027807 RepID=UPI002367B13C|nr:MULTISPECIES: S-adenosylmethionine decarboxylase [unclassified Paenibacillus]